MANKYQLETIPVWDGIKSGSECFICDLMQKAEKDSLDFYLGSSVMNPETRVRVNNIGFCPEHTAKLVESGRPNSMAVMWESHFGQTKEKLNRILLEMENGKNLKKATAHIEEMLKDRECECLICQRMQDRLERYCFTVAYIWGQDQEFRKAFDQSKGFCLPHMKEILRLSLQALDGKIQKEFAQSLAALQRRNLDRVTEELVYMIEQYRSENRDRPWNGCEDAQKRAVYKEIGQGRCDRK